MAPRVRAGAGQDGAGDSAHTLAMFPFLVLVALAAQAMGVLNACGRFGVPALASTFFNIGSVVVGLALGWTVGRRFEQG